MPRVKKTGREILGELVNHTVNKTIGYELNDYADKDITQALASLAKLMSEEEIADILLETSAKEINQTMGFMLNNSEALIFAKAIHTKFKERLG